MLGVCPPFEVMVLHSKILEPPPVPVVITLCIFCCNLVILILHFENAEVDNEEMEISA